MDFDLHKILIWRIRKMYVNGCERTHNNYFQAKHKHHHLISCRKCSPFLDNVRPISSLYSSSSSSSTTLCKKYRCDATMYNLDNSIKVNMEKVFWQLKYGKKSRIIPLPLYSFFFFVRIRFKQKRENTYWFTNKRTMISLRGLSNELISSPP